MAIELHHLNTHGMMEQAGNVLDGVVRLKQRIAELEEENQTLAEDVSDKIESITELMELVEKYKSEKAELEEERRHNKYKRCLGLKEVCLMELDYAFRDPCIERSVAGCVRWRKWANRWDELAQFFKLMKF